MNATSVIDALLSRRSVRAFLPEKVSRKTITEILEYASRSPSASNTQPWKVHVCKGGALAALSTGIIEAHHRNHEEHTEEFPYYPSSWMSPYLERRRKVGKDLYGLLKISKGDTAGMQHQYARNYLFFDAPVGLFFTIERQLVSGHAAWMDLGAFLHGVMLVARHYGLATCAQQAFARYHKVIRQHIPISDSEIVVCGMSLGFEAETAPANQLRTQREPIDSFASFTGFTDTP